MSPPLVVAYALAGRIDIDLDKEPLGEGTDGEPVFLQRHLADARSEVTDVVARRSSRRCSEDATRVVFEGDERWQKLDVPHGRHYAWETTSTYIKHPPYFDGMTKTPGAGRTTSTGARVLARAGRQHHDRPHLARGQHQEGRPGRQVPDRATASTRRTSTATARAAATTR